MKIKRLVLFHMWWQAGLDAQDDHHNPADFYRQAIWSLVVGDRGLPEERWLQRLKQRCGDITFGEGVLLP